MTTQRSPLTCAEEEAEKEALGRSDERIGERVKKREHEFAAYVSTLDAVEQAVVLGKLWNQLASIEVSDDTHSGANRRFATLILDEVLSLASHCIVL